MADLSNEEANDLADEILLRSEFLPAREPGLFGRTVDRVLTEISDFIAWLFRTIFGGSGGAAGNVLAIVLLCVAGVVLVLAVVKAFSGRVPKPETDETPGTRVVFDEIVAPEELRAELSRHRAVGDWRAAVIAGFRLSVIGLIDANIAREVAGATTGDFATAVQRRRPELLSTYRAGAASFERAFYSDFAVDESDVANVDALLASLSLIGASS
ncbi:MAG: DUF4129 domain-containing protein [Acidimicrobiia bacterium]|nr:DUF4129 domain-containing protein [Acidimicrobiia bacterium]